MLRRNPSLGGWGTGAQRHECIIPGSIQGQYWWIPGQSHLVVENPVHGSRLEQIFWWPFRSLPTEAITWFDDSMILREWRGTGKQAISTFTSLHRTQNSEAGYLVVSLRLWETSARLRLLPDIGKFVLAEQWPTWITINYSSTCCQKNIQAFAYLSLLLFLPTRQISVYLISPSHLNLQLLCSNALQGL